MTLRRLLVFDVDGTLVDSLAQISASMQAAFSGSNLTPPTVGDIRAIIGLSLPIAIARLAPELDAPAHDQLVTAYKNSFALSRTREIAPLFPGAQQAIARLGARRDLVLGVATGKSRRGLTQVLSAHGLADAFATTQVADDHPSKPDPSMLRAALAETGADPARAMMIGDTTFDIEMGLAAGLQAVGVAWGYHSTQDLLAAGAHHIIGDFDELDAILGARG